MVDAAHDKESRARDTINQLKLEIANLTKLVEQGAGLNFGQDASVQELMKQKEELTKERDAQLEDIVKVSSSRICIDNNVGHYNTCTVSLFSSGNR